LSIPNPKERAERRDRQTREFEENQRELKDSIAQSKRLVDEAEAMIRRHRDECAEADEQ
jgi:hypothetical protein